MFNLVSIVASLFSHSPLAPVEVPQKDPSIDDTIRKVEAMVSNPSARRLVSQSGLSLMNVTWEDTGRSKNSVWGPNISDMTIGVRDSQGLLHPMPVMRFANYSDVTADVSAEKFSLLVGNQAGQDLRPVSLRDVLAKTRDYLHNRNSWGGVATSLWADRDEHVLVSAQGAFLPVSKTGDATFTPVLYNYQSRPGAPAVATIVATSRGTSIQVVENSSGYMSEELFFNDNGQRAPFTATRLSTFNRTQKSKGKPQATEDDGLDVVLVIQVPLKTERVVRSQGVGGIGDGAGGGGYMKSEMEEENDLMPQLGGRAKMQSNVEVAVIGTGATEGPFKEINQLAIERDASFPIRVTVQFYKATSNGVVSQADVAKVRSQIDRVYAEGDWVGSLVTGGYTARPTESQPRIWADGFFQGQGWGWLK